MDPWLDGLWEAIKEALSKMNAEEAAESCPPDVQLNLLSITDHDGPQQQSREEVPTSPASPSASPAQPAVSDLGSVPPTRSSESASRPSDAAAAPTSAAGLQKDQAELSHAEPVASLTRSLPPLSESSLNVPALPSPYLEVSLQQAETTVEVNLWLIKWILKSSLCGVSNVHVFSSDRWAAGQGKSSRGPRIQGSSADQRGIRQDGPPARAGHLCKLHFSLRDS